MSHSGVVPVLPSLAHQRVLRVLEQISDLSAEAKHWIVLRRNVVLLPDATQPHSTARVVAFHGVHNACVGQCWTRYWDGAEEAAMRRLQKNEDPVVVASCIDAAHGALGQDLVPEHAATLSKPFVQGWWLAQWMATAGPGPAAVVRTLAPEWKGSVVELAKLALNSCSDPVA